MVCLLSSDWWSQNPEWTGRRWIISDLVCNEYSFLSADQFPKHVSQSVVLACEHKFLCLMTLTSTYFVTVLIYCHSSWISTLIPSITSSKDSSLCLGAANSSSPTLWLRLMNLWSFLSKQIGTHYLTSKKDLLTPTIFYSSSSWLDPLDIWERCGGWG